MNSPAEIAVVIPAYNEELLIRGTLDSLSQQQTEANYRIVLVDNGSTDGTAEIASDFPGITVLEEPRKGTGFAANTGFTYAIGEYSPRFVMRTDADTVPAQDWIESARHYLGEHPGKQLISGLVRPLKDQYYRPTDELLLPASYAAYRIGVTALKRTLWPLRVARGGNMAIRPQAFESVDGFPNGAIDDIDDDLELTRRIYKEYGFDGLGNVHGMEVRTSMRRIRRTGYFGLLNYYLNFTNQSLSDVRSTMTDGNIDIR